MPALFVPAFVIALALAGCTAQPSSATRVYSAASATMFESAKQNWLVSDKPEKSTLVVQVDGFGGRQALDIPRQTFEQTAAAFLAKSGRKCRILSGTEVMSQTYEFAYRCDGRS
jgi:hypothetical protein